MANSDYTQYPWLISFADLKDEAVIRHGNTYLMAKPSATANYYIITAKKLIGLAAKQGISEDQFLLVTIPHQHLVDYMINYLQSQVCLNNIGLIAGADIRGDVYKVKYDIYDEKASEIEGKLSYNHFLDQSGYQPAQVEAQSRNFNIYS
jgi:hypothetical protein